MRLLAAAALLCASPALAWEAMCRTNDLVSTSGPRVSTSKLEKAICEDEREKSCEGIAFARGVQLGEHAAITRSALIAAGFGPEYTDEAHVFETIDLQSPPMLRQGYFTQGKADLDPALDSLEPQGPSKMSVFAPREVALPELSDLSDWSHSLAEFALGNEHCIPRNVKRKTREDVDMCHGFRKGHMGSINANHWPPLSREVYRRFHGLAKQLANRCRIMESRRATDPSPVAARMRLLVKACQRESLAMEAYAAHFLEDAFATGHMFERWGSPTFGRSQVDKLRQSMAGIVVGTIHGARAVTHNHDRANMPGPNDPVSGGGFVEFKWANEQGLHPGGGDMYLRPCLENAKGWNVSEGEQLAPQYRRMLTCVARGFREVYDDGPDSRAPLPAETGLEQASFGSLSDACWSQRLTNQSMMMSLSVRYWADIDLVDFARAGFWSRTYVKKTLGAQLDDRALEVTDRQLEREKTRMRVALVTLANHYTWSAFLDPDGTDVATMSGFNERLRDVFGNDANTGKPAVPWSGLFLPDVIDGGIPFYEAPTLTQWITPADSAACVDDDSCQEGYYCDQAALEVGTARARPRCVRHETALSRAFRAAETLALCRSETWEDLQAARLRCRDSGSRFSDACQACVQVVAPRLRNACDPGSSFQPRSHGVDNRAICDHYQTFSASGLQGFVHVPYKLESATETWEQAFERVVTKACLDGPEDAGTLPRAIDYKFGTGIGDAGFPPVFLQTRYQATCGKGLGQQWFGWTVVNTELMSSISVGVALRPADRNINETTPNWPYVGQPEDLILESFPAPACDGTGTGTRAALMGGVQRLGFTVPPLASLPICVRVTVRDETVRTGYQLSIGRPPTF